MVSTALTSTLPKFQYLKSHNVVCLVPLDSHCSEWGTTKGVCRRVWLWGTPCPWCLEHPGTVSIWNASWNSSVSFCPTWTLLPFEKRTPHPQNRNGGWVMLKEALQNPSPPPAQAAVLIRGKIQHLLHRKESSTIVQHCGLCFLSQHVQGLTELFQSTSWKLWKKGISLENVSSTKSTATWEEKAIFRILSKELIIKPV